MRRKPLSHLLCSLTVALGLSGAAHAGMYDVEIENDIARGLPPFADLLAGRFERHTTLNSLAVVSRSKVTTTKPDEYNVYQLTDPSDLACALVRLGDPDGALVALNEYPRILWHEFREATTRGSIQIARGEYADAVEALRLAVKLRPRSLFAREQYELMMAEHLLEASRNPTRLPARPTFVRDLLVEISGSTLEPTAPSESIFESPRRGDPRLDEALGGVGILIRTENPGQTHLWAALGDLLRFKGEDALAYRAYRRAILAQHPQADYFKAQLEHLRLRVKNPRDVEEATIRAEIAAADRWVAAFQAREKELHDAGKTFYASEDYADFYATHGDPRQPRDWRDPLRRNWPMIAAASLLLIVVALLARRALAERGGRLNAAG